MKEKKIFSQNSSCKRVLSLSKFLVNMDFQFKVTGENSGCDSSNDENEYHMEIQFTSLNFDDKAIENIQVILLNGDLMNKIDVHRQDVKLFDEIDEDHQDNEFRIENIYYIIHSTPTRFAEKLLDVPIIVLFLTDDQQIIGKYPSTKVIIRRLSHN